jgi:hypothetical protein
VFYDVWDVTFQELIPMNTIDLLTRLKAANHAASDYRAAQLLGVKPQTVYRWVKGKHGALMIFINHREL